MSAPVDVLAVLDRAFGAANEHYDDLKSTADEPALGPAYQRACRYMAEHREVRAAVAELIEAVQALSNQQDVRDWDDLTVECGDETSALWDRVDTALARVKGGAA